MTMGKLYPVDVQEVYPGDTFKNKTTLVSRLTSQFLRPVMDNLFLDVYHFFVPSRLCYDKFVNIFGENTESAWANTVEYEVPVVKSGIVRSKTVADYMGLPVGLDASKVDVNIIPFRAFAKIWNEWFRDQNNVAPMHIHTSEASDGENFDVSDWSPANYMGKLPYVARFHDYFTSALPAPQKGSSVNVSAIDFKRDVAVYAGYDNPNPVNTNISIRYKSDMEILPPGTYFLGSRVVDNRYIDGTALSAGTNYTSYGNLTPINLWADTKSLSVDPITVNDLRFAFQYQRMLERAARSGTRYVEYLASAFGVEGGDYRLQRSEFLGGKRIPININQVVQTAGANSGSSPLGEVGAFSHTGGMSRYTKGFTEHGYVITVACIRQFHTYQQGLERFWSRRKQIDFYDPVFSHIGEQPILKKELFVSNNREVDEKPFGYQEAWADLRTRQSKVTGELRSSAENSLDFWHFADEYTNAPVLNETFINETPDFVDRTITVQSSNQDQFIIDFYFRTLAYRVMPVYSSPGLIDHN